MLDLRLGDYATVLCDVRADLIVTSPPYNIGSKADRKDGQRKFGKFDPKSFRAITDYPDDMDEADYQRSQIAFLNWCATTLRRNGTLVYNHKPRRRNNTMIHPMEWISKVPRLTLMEEVIWNRGSTHNHSPRLLWPQTERLYILRRTDGMYRIANRQGCPQRSDVWGIPIPRNNGHNAPFPESLVAACLSLYSSEGDTVVDPYSGSGTVALVCRRMNRKFVGSEALPKYHALAQKRLAA